MQCSLIYSQIPLAAWVTRQVRIRPACTGDRRRDHPSYLSMGRAKNPEAAVSEGDVSGGCRDPLHERFDAVAGAVDAPVDARPHLARRERRGESDVLVA